MAERCAGVHAGEVYEVDGRLIGLCVNHTARVIAEADPDEILTTAVVQGLVEGSGFASFEGFVGAVGLDRILVDLPRL